MGSLSYTDALARLLANAALRRQFARDPYGTIAPWGLAKADQANLVKINLAQLESQAKALIQKRQFEVFRLMPDTVGNLGKRAVEVFEQYAETNWPEGHRRHLLDACGFASHLMHHEPNAIDQSELHVLTFVGSKRLFSIRIVRSGYHLLGRRVQILYRLRGQYVRHLGLYLGLR